MEFNLTEEQDKVAAHIGTPFRLLAGPGTGKTATLVARVVRLVEGGVVLPRDIHVLTFTRATARELRDRIQKMLPNETGKETRETPAVSTIHSYALSKLLEAGESIVALPQPLRIADDWEERNIILEELKHLRGLKHIDQIRKLFNSLSACWHNSTDPDTSATQESVDAGFLGAWQQHRKVYGYSLRAELVYQLKLALERREQFRLAAPQHLLVDEYQDLNRCELDVVLELRKRGAEVFVSGDDDQSIYGFRNADPKGIRKFGEEYPDSDKGAVLSICQRCAPNILDIGEHVANLDPDRIQKDTRPRPGRSDGTIAILRFRNQHTEAAKIAEICGSLMNNGKIEKAGDIFILFRDDRHGMYSKPITEHLEKIGIPVATADKEKPLDRKDGRILLSFMRLAANAEDSLAWRTLLQLWCQGVGPKAFHGVYEFAVDTGNTFAQQVHDQQLPSQFRKKISEAVAAIESKLSDLFPNGDQEFETADALIDSVRRAARNLFPDSEGRESIVSEFERVSDTIDKFSIKDLVRNSGGADEDLERGNDDDDGVRMMTMHKAKGLTAKAVVIAGAENERIPGAARGEKEKGDTRRLLYVSLTRAESFLFVTYCETRTGNQQYGGSAAGTKRRNLTEFLHGYRERPPVPGEQYVPPWEIHE